MESESTSLSASLGLDGSLGVSGATAATGAGEDTSLSEQDLQHSLQAHKEYQDLNLTQCLEALTALQVSRPEDPLIAHNLCLVKYLNQEMDLEAMAKELEALYLQVMSGNDVEECEHQALVYNLALTFFLKKNLVRAEQLLRKLYLSCTAASSADSPTASPSSSSSSSSASSLANSVQNYILPLLTTLSLMLRMPASALTFLNEMEPKGGLESGGGGNGPPSSVQVLQRAQALVLSKAHKAFKKDVKAGDLEPEDAVAFDFLRANLEYIKGHHKKAQKLLSSQVGKPGLTPYNTSLFYNNLGCLHVFFGKPNLAVHYFISAFKGHCTELSENKVLSERPDRLHYSRKVEIVYNQAIALLHAGQIEQAFHNFQTCVTVYRSHPQLWLHLAECCIVACSEPCEHAQQMLKRREASEATEKDLMRLSFQILETPHSQKYILNTAAQRHSSLYNQGDGHSATKPALTLPFAYSCLRNAHAILCKLESEPNVPNPLPISSKLYLVKAVVLIKLSYVALRVGDPFMAAKYSQEVLMKHTQIPGGHLALAKLYAAESMIQLDKMSEAIELLDPKTIEDVGFECDAAGKDPSPEEKASRCAAHVSAQEALAATRAIFNFNLAVAYMQRGELSKADELLKDLWESRAEHQIGTKVFTAQLYSHLKRGNIKECRESIRKRCLKYF